MLLLFPSCLGFGYEYFGGGGGGRGGGGGGRVDDHGEH